MKIKNNNKTVLVFAVIIQIVIANSNVDNNYLTRKYSLRALPLIKELSEQNGENSVEHKLDGRKHNFGVKEEEYAFANDKTSTRFRVTEDNTSQNYENKDLVRAFRAMAARRIVGGLDTRISVHPYNTAISKNGRHWCGGSIIDEQWVLTAGHCMESAYDGTEQKLRPFMLRAGSSFHNRGGYQAKINKVFFPPGYSPGNADYDFALLRLDRPLPIGRNIAVLNLPSKDYVLENDDVLIVSGWGSTDESGLGSIPERLRFVPVPIMTELHCQKSYRFYITPRMLCAGYESGGKDACNHDSGGPAVRDGVLLGVVSFGGKKCGDPSAPGVYGKVSEVTEWIQRIITSNEANTAPELIPKIKKQRQREYEIEKFKTRVEDKKNIIKNWLKLTFNWPKFLELAKRKLIEVTKRSRRMIIADVKPLVVNFNNEEEEDFIDNININNQIKDRILNAGVRDDLDIFLHALALEEAIYSDSKEDK